MTMIRQDFLEDVTMTSSFFSNDMKHFFDCSKKEFYSIRIRRTIDFLLGVNQQGEFFLKEMCNTS